MRILCRTAIHSEFQTRLRPLPVPGPGPGQKEKKNQETGSKAMRQRDNQSALCRVDSGLPRAATCHNRRPIGVEILLPVIAKQRESVCFFFIALPSLREEAVSFRLPHVKTNSSTGFTFPLISIRNFIHQVLSGK